MRLWSNWLPMLAALGIAVCLLLPEDAVERAALAGTEVIPPSGEGDLLGAQALEARTADLSVPSLAGSAATPRRDLKSAVVTVYSGGQAKRRGVPVRITDPGAARPVSHALTDPRGQVHLAAVPLDGTVRVEALDRWVSPRRAARAAVVGSADVKSAEVAVHCYGGMPFEVRVYDAVSGEPIGTSAVAVPTPARPLPAGVIGTRRIVVHPGDKQTLGLSLPDDELHRSGYVAWDAEAWETRVSRYAERIEVVYPLRREARVQVYAQEHDGTPTERAVVRGFQLAGRHVTDDVRAVPSRGGFLLRGVPYFREEPLQVLLVRPPTVSEDVEEIEEVCIEHEYEEDDSLPYEESLSSDLYPGAAVGHGRLPRVWAELLVVTARFPKDTDEIVIFGGSGSSSCRSSCRRLNRRDTGRVQVTVQRRSGEPAVGALVRVGSKSARTDFRGWAVFESVRVGEHAVRLKEPGLVTSAGKVTVRADKTSRVALREEAGATVKIRVVDAEGEGLPFARLSVPASAGWVDLQSKGFSKAVQRIDPFTDAKGRRTLRRFPAGTWKFQAHYGSRKGTAEVQLAHGATKTVTLTLK